MKFKIKKSYYRLFSVLLSLVMIVISVPIMSINANATDEDFSGVWLFNNVKYSDKYIHINNNNNMKGEGEIIELHKYNPYWALRWYIKSIGNGYYKIESVWSEKVLTAPTGFNNDIVRQTDYTGAYTQQWKFIKQSDGTYKISPRSNLNYFLAAGNLSSTADQDLEIRTVQSDEGDKWYVCEKRVYRANVNIYYDKGYYVYYNESSTISATTLNSYIANISTRFDDLIGLKLITKPAEYFQSNIDICKQFVSTANINTLCSINNDTHSNCTVLFDSVKNDFMSHIVPVP